MKLIPLSTTSKVHAGKYFAKVDDEDYDFLMQWKWHFSRVKNKIYAIRSDRSSGVLKIVKMHRVIM